MELQYYLIIYKLLVLLYTIDLKLNRPISNDTNLCKNSPVEILYLRTEEKKDE